MDLKDSISIEDLSAVAEEGQTTNIDNEYSFSRNKPLAMSTVAREERNQKYKQTADDVKSGSFLNNNSISTPPGGDRNQQMQQLRLSFSAVEQSNTASRPREVTGSKSEQLVPKQDESLLSLNSWGQPPYGIMSDFDISRKSSLGLIQVDAMSDLTGSMFNLDIPGMEPNKQGNRSVQGSGSHTSVNNQTESQGTSLANSQGQVSGSDSQSSSQMQNGSLGTSQRLGSSTDSHSTLKTAFFRHDVDTVKKKPSEKPASIPEGPVRQSLVFKEMFGGQHDGDVTLPEVNIDREELNMLDDDFSDFNDTGIDEVEDDKKELTPDNDALDSIYLKVMSHNGGDGAENTQNAMLFPSLSKVTLFDDIGSSEDLRNVEGKQTTAHSSEIDTEDELEMARQSMGLEREVAAGQCSDNRASIPRPGVEGTSQQEMTGNPLSIAMRQSAEGDVVTSPVPGDGGGGGDGSSGSESEDRAVRRSTDAKDFIDAFRPNFRPVNPLPSGSLDIEEQRVKPMGDDLLTEKGIDRYYNYQGNNMENESLLQSRYLAPTPMFNASDTASQIRWSMDNNSFPTDLQSQVTTSQTTQDPGSRLEASGFNAEDIFSGQQDDNPFGDVRNSFGSFAASPPHHRQSHNMTPTGDITLEPPVSPRTSVDSKSQYGGNSPKFSEEPKFSLASPQPSQSVRNSHKSVQEVKPNGVDLAFVSSLSTEAAEQKALVSEMVAQGNYDVNFTINEDFISSDKARNLLDDDEKEFEKENIFREDENMEGDVFPESDSWTLKSKISVPDDDICRISVGQFMKSRSGALGSLDGDGPRPDFGMIIKTPPSARKPYPLLETTENEQNSEQIDTFSIDNSEGTLRMSDISRFMSSVSMSKDPKEIANMVMAWSHKESKKAKDSQTKSSKLPIKKGSNLKSHEKRLLSEDMSLSELEPKKSEKSAVTRSSQESFDKSERKFSEHQSVAKGHPDVKVTQHQPEVKVSERSSFSYENKTNPDGEESDKEDFLSYDVRTPPRTSVEGNIIDGYSPRLSVSRLKKSNDDLIKLSDGLVKASERITTSLDGMNESLERFLGHQTEKDDFPIHHNGDDQTMGQVPKINMTTTSGHYNASVNPRFEGVLSERSPRGSTSGWAGHHIPDGTEYSRSSDLHEGLSRQELDGTEDIHLVDSRGFDAISNKYQDQKPVLSEISRIQQYPIKDQQSKTSDVPKSRQNLSKEQQPIFSDASHNQLYLSEEQFVTSQGLQKRHSDFDPRKHHAMLKAQAKKHPHSYSAENLTSTPVKNQEFFSRRSEDQLLLASTLPGQRNVFPSNHVTNHTRSLTESDSHERQREQLFSQTLPEKSHEQRKNQNLPSSSDARKTFVKNIEQNDPQNTKMAGQDPSARSPEPHSQNVLSDDMLMPPPPVPSFRHNLLPRDRSGQSDKPTLLTSDSMMSKDFAKDYLVREDPRRLVNRDIHPKPMEHPIDNDSMFSHRESDIPLPTHHDWPGEDMNISNRLPVYHSTPYNNNRVDTTIITPSTMHTMMSTGMMTELQADNLTMMEDERNQTRTQPRLSAVTAPSVLKFSEVCCVGISTETSLCLTNPTKNWLECLLQVQEWTIDGREIGIMDYSPFEMKRKVIIEPHTSEHVTVIFIPKIAGVYVAQLNISSGLFLQDNSVQIQKIPTVVTLQAIAEKPQIQVNACSYNKCMNFGHVAWGSCHDMSLQIINRGQASVPLRLSISLSQGSWHSFSFDTKLADISVISRSNRPQSAAIGRTVMPVCVRGRNADSEPTIYDIKVYCRPPEKQYNRAMAQYPPTEMFARIDVEVDTPSHLPLISSLDLKAVVGVAKLHLSRQLEILQFKASNKQQVRQTFELRNAGNIDMKLLLGVLEYKEYFTIDPSQLTIPPGQEAAVTVMFLPMSGMSVDSIETVMVMSILPQGPDYDLPIRVEIRNEPVHVPTTHGPVLLGDRQFIDFGGVPVGKSLVKKYTLKNKLNSVLKLLLEVRSDTDSFQLLWNDRRSYTRELIINGGEKFLVNMEYRPTAVRQHQAKLVIKPEGMTVKFSIPLEGYGGTSVLLIEGASVIEGSSLLDQKYWLNFTGIEPSRCQIQKIVVKNIGARASFVKAVCFTDPRCKHLMRPPKVLIEPNEFIIPEKGSKSVTIVFNPSERECALCSDGREIIGAVAFLFGDEVSRQRMRRVIHDGQGVKRIPRSLCDDNILYSINFNTQYIDEDCVPELPAAIRNVGASKDIDLFYKNISKVMLTLVASAVPSQSYSANLANNVPSNMQNGNLASTMPARGHISTMPSGSMGSNLGSIIPGEYMSGSVMRDQSSFIPPRNLASTIPNRNTSTVSPISRRTSTGSQLSDEPVRHTNRESVSNTMPDTVIGLLFTRSLLSDHDDKSEWESVSNTMPDTVIGPLFTRSLLSDHDDKSEWLIKPDQIILHAPTKRDDRLDVSKFQIINFQNRQLTYKISWPNQWVRITPETVTVMPKSTTSVCISPSAGVLENMETLPWSGTIHVTCEDQYKVLGVQIRRDIKTDGTAGQNLVPLFKQSSVTPSICIPPDSDSGALQTNTTQVNFSPTRVGEMSETYIDLTNVSSEMLQWTISSFAPPYVKGADNSKDVFRATYKVFVFSEKFGHLDGKHSKQICMQFMPRSKGLFSQFWDIQSRGSSTNSVRVELKGEGLEEDTRKLPEKETKKRPEATFTLENAEMTHEFSPCDIGHVQMIKVQLKNKTYAQQTVEVIPPQPPFVVKYSSFSVKPKSYLRFPIEFRPSSYGEFNGLVIFKPSVENSISCKIHAVCKKL